MTVSTSTNNVVYRGNGATTQFAVPFKVLDEDHLLVRRRDYTTGEILYTYAGTDFTYSGIGDDAGTLTLAGIALDDDYELVIERIVPYTQDLDIVNAGGFYPETVENQLDLITMGVQQLVDLVNRGAIVPVGETGLVLSKASDRASKFFGFDSEGDFAALSGTGTDAALRTDLAASTGGALVGILPDGFGALATSLASYVKRGPIFVETYRQPGYTDAQTIQAAVNALIAQGGGTLLFPKNGNYDYGVVASTTSLIAIAGLNNATIDFNGSLIQVTSSGSVTINMFYLSDGQNITLKNLRTKDNSGAGFSSGNRGTKLVVIDGSAITTFKNLTLENISGDTMNTWLAVQANAASRIDGINLVGSNRADNCFYGINCAENGDNIKGSLRLHNCGRAWFPYGCVGHDLDLDISADGASQSVDTSLLIKRYSRDTKGHKVRANFSGTLNFCTNLCTLEHQNNDGAASIIDDIDLTINVTDGTTDSGITRVLLRSYQVNGTENTGSIAHWTKLVHVAGKLGQTTVPHIKARYTPTVPGVIALDVGLSGLSPTKTIDAPGWITKTAPDRYVFEYFSAGASGLNGATIPIPVADLQLLRGAFRIVTYAEDISTNAAGAGAKMHLFDDFVAIYVNSGAANVGFVTGSPDRREKAFNSSDLTLTYVTGTDQIVMTFASAAHYRTTTAFVRVEVHAISRPIKR